MGFTAVAIGAGVLIGYLRGGRLLNLAAADLRGARWLVAGLAMQVASGLLGGALGLTLLTLSYGALLVFAALSWRTVGIAVAGVGIALNALVIVVDAGMPVRAEAIVDAGLADADDLATVELSGKRHMEHDGDVLMVLADVIPVRPLRAVLSFGDLILGVGVADAVSTMMRRRSAVPAETQPVPA